MAAIFTPTVIGGSPTELVLRAATAAYLGRYRGQTRLHSESDLRVFLHWCTDHDLDPLAAVRVDIERYLRWLQDVLSFDSEVCPCHPTVFRTGSLPPRLVSAPAELRLSAARHRG